MGTDKNLLNFLADLCEHGPVNYHDFIQTALYAPCGGYYTKAQNRVGRHAKRDFYTAESLGKVFSRLVTAAIQSLAGEEFTRTATFIEIAAEPDYSFLQFLDRQPFAESRMIGHADALNAHGPSVIFANEWLDALPFHRLRYVDGEWKERAVAFDRNTQKPYETYLETLSPAVQKVAYRLPAVMPEGYELDLPLAAEAALDSLLQHHWTGLILLFDYGKTWKALTTDCPSGTARTYKNHQMGSDLLEDPGERDITCDICWDPLIDLFNEHQFSSLTLESQEAFFVKRAENELSSIFSAQAGQFSSEKQTIMELIHPNHMGQRFQVLWGIR